MLVQNESKTPVNQSQRIVIFFVESLQFAKAKNSVAHQLCYIQNDSNSLTMYIVDYLSPACSSHTHTRTRTHTHTQYYRYSCMLMMQLHLFVTPYDTGFILHETPLWKNNGLNIFVLQHAVFLCSMHACPSRLAQFIQ